MQQKHPYATTEQESMFYIGQGINKLYFNPIREAEWWPAIGFFGRGSWVQAIPTLDAVDKLFSLGDEAFHYLLHRITHITTKT